MIVGYYGAAFFGGAKCIKIYDNSKGTAYFEHISCMIPNILKGADEGIKDNLSIVKHIDLNRCFHENCKIIRNRVSSDRKKRIEEYMDSIDWEYLSKQKYTASCFDSLCWELFINYKEKEYMLKGYHVVPEEIKTLIKYLDELE